MSRSGAVVRHPRYRSAWLVGLSGSDHEIATLTLKILGWSVIDVVPTQVPEGLPQLLIAQGEGFQSALAMSAIADIADLTRALIVSSPQPAPSHYGPDNWQILSSPLEVGALERLVIEATS